MCVRETVYMTVRCPLTPGAHWSGWGQKAKQSGAGDAIQMKATQDTLAFQGKAWEA